MPVLAHGRSPPRSLVFVFPPCLCAAPAPPATCPAAQRAPACRPSPSPAAALCCALHPCLAFSGSPRDRQHQGYAGRCARREQERGSACDAEEGPTRSSSPAPCVIIPRPLPPLLFNPVAAIPAQQLSAGVPHPQACFTGRSGSPRPTAGAPCPPARRLAPHQAGAAGNHPVPGIAHAAADPVHRPPSRTEQIVRSSAARSPKMPVGLTIPDAQVAALGYSTVCFATAGNLFDQNESVPPPSRLLLLPSDPLLLHPPLIPRPLHSAQPSAKNFVLHYDSRWAHHCHHRRPSSSLSTLKALALPETGLHLSYCCTELY